MAVLNFVFEKFDGGGEIALFLRQRLHGLRQPFVLLVGGAIFMLQAHPFELQTMNLGAENSLLRFRLAPVLA